MFKRVGERERVRGGVQNGHQRVYSAQFANKLHTTPAKIVDIWGGPKSVLVRFVHFFSVHF